MTVYDGNVTLQGMMVRAATKIASALKTARSSPTGNASRILRNLRGVWIMLPAALALYACSQEPAPNDTAGSNVMPAATYSISGTITDDSGTPLQGVTVILGGDASATTLSDAKGNYTFTGLARGNYTISTDRAGYSFAAVSQAVTISRGSVTNINCVATPIPPPSPATYGISGRVSDGSNAPVGGVIVALSGNANSSVSTDANGNFSFAGLASGAYTVTPSKSATTFMPVSQAVNITTGDATGINFTAASATASIYSATGRIATGSGIGIGGVTVALSGGSSGSVSTDITGNYAFAGLGNGDYTVTPSLAGYTFAPVNRAATVNNANIAGINFTGTPPAPPTYSLSGRVITGAGVAISGATVALTGAAVLSVTSDVTGNYVFAGLNAGTYTVAPAFAGYSFAPTSQTIAVATANISGINFTGTPPPVATYSISGHIADKSGGAVSGVALTAGGATAATDANGNFTLGGLSNGTYTLAPSLSGYSFAPATLSVAVNGANVSTADFVATPPVPGTRNFTLYVTAGTLTVHGAGGAAIPAWSFTDVAGAPKFPGPLLNVNEGDTVNITVRNDHSANHNFVIKGITTDTAAITSGASKTYTFTAASAGTYLYYDSLNNEINREMGLYGALIVNPKDGGNTPWAGAPNYTFQRTWLTGDMDKPFWNDVAGSGGVVNTAAYKPNYFLINGMGGEDAMKDKVNTAIDGRVGQTALVRILNAGLYPQTFHFHANHVQVLSINGVRRTAPYRLLDVIQVPPLGGADVLFQLNQPGVYPMHNHTAQMETANGVYLNGVATLIYIAP